MELPKEKLTVALVMRKSDSCVTVSTSGELFIIVFTLARGKLAPPRGLDILKPKIRVGDGVIPQKMFVYKENPGRLPPQNVTFVSGITQPPTDQSG